MNEVRQDLRGPRVHAVKKAKSVLPAGMGVAGMLVLPVLRERGAKQVLRDLRAFKATQG